MQTRSSLGIQVLEQRQKKRSERKARELQELLEAAGCDRPNIDDLTDSTPLTRQKTKEKSRSSSGSSYIQVVIESPRIFGASGHPSTTKSEAQDDDTNSTFGQIKPPVIRTTLSVGSEQAGRRTAEEGFGAPTLHSSSHSEVAVTRPVTKQSPATEDSFTQQGVLGAFRKRKQLDVIRGVVDAKPRKRPRKSRSTLFDGLNKALQKLESSPKLSLDTSSKFPGNLFPASGGLSKHLKRVKLVPRRLLDISLKRRTKHFTISLGANTSVLIHPKPGAQKTQPINPTLSPVLPGDHPGAERESPSATSGKGVSERTSLHPLPPHNSESDMGTLRRSSKRADSTKTKGALHGTGMSDESNDAHQTSPHDHAMTDSFEYQDEELPKAIFPLTDECKHYTKVSQVDWDIQKYWHQRKSIFSLYDEGIRMTDDAWFGVTPEPVANKVAEDFAAFCDPSKTVIIDMFAGAGGNTIAFALSGRWSKVIGIEKDASAIACAHHNAAIYGVADQITFINDDSFSYLAANSSSIDVSQTVIFASPPWGGPGYRSDEVFNLKTMAPYSIKKIHSACKDMDSALYLPRTSDLRQIARLAPAGKKVEIVQYCMEGASKALTAYIPAASSTPSS